ncbi:unnamed protein product [Parascedosporium putredinis]|uniref:Protein BFR2 n=1 Tax=Parascedosporium putredinis TaxID=1442378 RepID=A0A9P1H4J4_9PEZI|nr:unnamed protein product [Parascedosporium putredinis]CAI7996061.1 unnamed protein product [Parascedosporium putredinis]
MPPKSSSRAKEFAELDKRPAQDYDPEDTRDKSDGDEDSENESEVERAGTEHYVSQEQDPAKDAVTLGPQYRGTRVSREALQDDDDDDDDDDESQESDDDEEGLGSGDKYDDPDKADLTVDMKRLGDEDFEIDSDEAFNDSDEERFQGHTFRGSSKTKKGSGEGRKTRPIAADFMTDSEKEDQDDAMSEDGDEGDEDSDDDGAALGSSGEEEEDEEEEEEEEDEEDDEDGGNESEESDGGVALGSDLEEEEEEESDASQEEDASKSGSRSDKKTVLAAISDSAKQDAGKGQAVRQQRKIFDGLLNIRVRLQKALIAANTFGQIDQADDDDDDDAGAEAYAAAEAAALKLWSTIDDLRSGITSKTKTGDKRKRDIDVLTSNDTIWGYMDETEQAARANRKKVLDKWSNKIGATTVPVGNRLNLGATRSSISSVLDEQLLAPGRLLYRSRDTEIYDDADFYQLLLKELVDQRSADSGTTGGQENGVVTVQWAAMKEAKSNKVVDRKASRGRKMRFTVHEKLQGFMASEDRRSWEQDAIDRFFGTLFGQKMQLNEDEEGSDEEDEEMNAEEAGLRLFRS